MYFLSLAATMAEETSDQKGQLFTSDSEVLL